MIPSDPDDRDVLAGEYVLGLADPQSTAAVERALPVDADLAARVAFWEERLLPAVSALPDVSPDPEAWARIERDLSARRSARDRVAPPVRRPSLPRRIWRSPAVWRGATALATAAAALLAVLPGRPWTAAESPTRFFALLQSRDATGGETGPGWLIQVASDGTVRSVPLADVQPGRGQALQLWTLWDTARGPVSLGVLPPGGAVRFPPERLQTIGSDQLFEITLEPEAGSPTGRPTGRILFIGRARNSAQQAL